MTRPGKGTSRRRSRWTLAGAALLCALGGVGAAPAADIAGGVAGPSAAGDRARDGEALARSAAAAWAPDARLIYVENDESLTDNGRAERWGYLFHSPSLDASRAYSVKGSKIVTAAPAPFAFAAPPLPGSWIDSDRALAAAEEKGLAYRTEHDGRVRSMFLVRGLLHQDEPDLPTWAVVYASSSAPSLWVVVNARTGKVVRTWRG